MSASALNLPEVLLVAALEYAAEYGEVIEADARCGKGTLKECGLDAILRACRFEPKTAGL